MVKINADGVRVAVVVLNYNGWKDTLDCLDSLLASEVPVYRVFVCDNKSANDSLAHIDRGVKSRMRPIEAVAKYWTECGAALVPYVRSQWSTDDQNVAEGEKAFVTLLDNQENGGFAKGNNTALRLLASDQFVTHFWLLNNDALLSKDSLARLESEINQRPDVDLWGGVVIYENPPDLVQALGGGHLNRLTAETKHVGAFRHLSDLPQGPDFVADVEHQLDYVLGASMIASRRWLESVGLLSEDFFLYYEEADWALRGSKNGLSIGFCKDLKVIHKEGASIGTDPSGGSVLSVFHLFRSRVIFARKHLPRIALLFVFSRIIIQAFKYLAKGAPSLSRAVIRGSLSGALHK